MSIAEMPNLVPSSTLQFLKIIHRNRGYYLALKLLFKLIKIQYN